MKIYAIAKKVTILVFLFLIHITCANGKDGVCQKIIEIYASGNFEKYQIPYQLQPDGNTKYEINFKGDKNHYVAISECGAGSGSDAVCDIRLTKNGRDAYNFSLPTHVGFVKIGDEIYLVNGVSKDRAGTLDLNGFMVHKLSRNKLEEACSNF